MEQAAPIDIRVVTGTSSFNNSIYNGGTIGNLTLAGKISGPGALFMGLGGTIPNGDGTVVLTNATNDFTGEFGIYLGTVQVNANNALGDDRRTTVNYQGTLAFNNVQYTTPERINISGMGVNSSGALRGIGASKVAGPVHLTGDTQISVDPASTLELSGQVTGAFAMAKTGDGKLVLSGTGNTWKGDTTLQAGSIDFASNHHIGQLIFSGGTTATVKPGNKLLRTTAVQFNDPASPNATLDLTDGRLIVDYADGSTTPLSQVRSAIIAAYNTAGASHWTSQGITSSTAATTPGRAVGYGEASEIVPTGSTTWLGEGNIDSMRNPGSHDAGGRYQPRRDNRLPRSGEAGPKLQHRCNDHDRKLVDARRLQLRREGGLPGPCGHGAELQHVATQCPDPGRVGDVRGRSGAGLCERARARAGRPGPDLSRCIGDAHAASPAPGVSSFSSFRMSVSAPRASARR